MVSGRSLVESYLNAFLAGRTEELERVLAPTFRFHFLPLDMGEGLSHVLRWRELSFAVYRKWDWTILDADDRGAEVIVWLKFIGTEPDDPESVNPLEDTSLVQFFIEDGRIVGCNAIHHTLEGHVANDARTQRLSAH